MKKKKSVRLPAQGERFTNLSLKTAQGQLLLSLLQSSRFKIRICTWAVTQLDSTFPLPKRKQTHFFSIEMFEPGVLLTDQQKA